MVRRTEVLRDGRWMELPFEQLEIGDVFRMWDRVWGGLWWRRVRDERMGGSDVWECLSAPFEYRGVMQIACRPKDGSDGG